MFQLQRAIFRPKMEHSSGTFSDYAVYGIPYCLYFILRVICSLKDQIENKI